MLRAGIAQIDVTPPVGVELSGYAGRTKPSQAVHDRLYARALVLESDRERVAIVSADLLGFAQDFVDRVRSQVEASCGIPASHLMLAATHTHSGPATMPLRGCGKPNPDYLAELEMKLVGLVAPAIESLQPARLGFAMGEISLGRDRRHEPPKDDPAWTGLVDPEVAVMRVDDEKKEPICIVMNYGCHAVAEGAVYEISADYPGYAVRKVQEEMPGTMAVFLNGAGGDINPRIRGGYQAAAETGHALAREVLRVARDSESTGEIEIGAGQKMVDFPQQPLPTLEKARENLESQERELDSAEKSGVSPGELRWKVAYRDWAREVLDMVEAGQQPRVSGEIQTIRLGEAALVGLPGEPFAELGLRIKFRSPFEPTLLVGYANGCVAYLPTEQAFAEGGYEPDTACRFYGTVPFKPELPRLLEDSALALLSQLK